MVNVSFHGLPLLFFLVPAAFPRCSLLGEYMAKFVLAVLRSFVYLSHLLKRILVGEGDGLFTKKALASVASFDLGVVMHFLCV